MGGWARYATAKRIFRQSRCRDGTNIPCKHFYSMTASVAFVGAGPTTLYTFKALVEKAEASARITIFEQQARAGLGTPYRPGWNDPAMLSNIASVEIPPLCETLVSWLGRQSRKRLIALGIDPREVDDRAFYPRVALGRYFLDQFDMLVSEARAKGLTVEIRTGCRVLDMSVDGHGVQLEIEGKGEEAADNRFDFVVMATGHQWPEDPEARPGYFLSPWPASALKRINAVNVGIRGSSLTAIDAVVALATAHGSFIDGRDGRVEYRIGAGSEGLRLTMMSRKGLLPEADFYHPIPYEPLAICTEAAIEALIAAQPDNLLEQAYRLFKKELAHADPVYADHVGLAGLPLEGFAERFFADRAQADPFEWAAANLQEAQANFEKEITVPWRYAILRMHEVLALVIPHLDEEALDAFARNLKPAFVDEYASVPHLSIERLLALHRAGHLHVLGLGDKYRIETHGADPGVNVIIDGEGRHYDVFIDATGQRPLEADDFPFPTLLEQGIVLDAQDAEEGSTKGISVDETFHPASPDPRARQIYCLSLPFILGRHPFVQGITSSHEMGGIVGEELARLIATPTQAEAA
ncbi:FAD/NAD(P)-binding protein [Sphingobium sp. H39-3-25]|uniref:FAD/NAD(P)-binding protein n=1 Tax=Sphingobium arseniciresistens TaxID=3030834 RepID=UPI0023BA0C4D|nr:FAD/NAD(P)-binding protein [Sphingobium arseniciresistens]